VDLLPLDQLEEIDRFFLARYGTVAAKVLDAYDAYDYPTIFQAINAFATVDLSALYIDISKDCLYTLAPRSHERRSTQTAMYLMADGLARLLAPILSVTAEQVWQYLPGRRDESVHLTVFPSAAGLQAFVDTDLLARWSRLLALRERVFADIERLRADKRVGKSLEAKVVLTATAADAEFLRQHEKSLPTLFIVSDVEIEEGVVEEGKPGVVIARADGVKCERCWRYVKVVSSDPAWAGICERCQDALAPTANA
jgi:isoleucyl-tRNA synthetase